MALLDTIPWLLGAAVVGFVAWRVGLKQAAVAAGAVIIALIYRKGRRDATQAAKIEEKDLAIVIHETGAEARRDADRRNADPGELRNDDGWRRD